MWNLESGHYDLKQASRPSKFLKNDYEAKNIKQSTWSSGDGGSVLILCSKICIK